MLGALAMFLWELILDILPIKSELDVLFISTWNHYWGHVGTAIVYMLVGLCWPCTRYSINRINTIGTSSVHFSYKRESKKGGIRAPITTSWQGDTILPHMIGGIPTYLSYVCFQCDQISRYFAKVDNILKVFSNYLRVYLIFRKMFSLLWKLFYAIGHI